MFTLTDEQQRARESCGEDGAAVLEGDASNVRPFPDYVRVEEQD